MNTRATFATALLALGSLAAPAQILNTAKLDSLLNGLVYSHAFGYAQLEPRVPATPATRYRIGSITKMFTGVLIFQLIEEKKLALDTKLATFFPQVPNARDITIDQLLSHRSGIHNFTNDPAYVGYMTQPKTQAELLAIIAQPQPDFAPGAKYEYSNSNFVLLTCIVEKLTRIPCAQALQKRVFTKAGLQNTCYGGKIDPQKQEAFSYETSGGGWQLSPETDMSIPAGAGALVSTPTDLDRFLEALFGGKLLSASSLAAMQDVRDGYGRAMLQAPFGEKKGYGHTGGIDAFRSVALYFPGDKLAVALCGNGGSFSPNEALVGARSIYFSKPYKIPNFAASAYAPTPADLDRYVGTYGSPAIPLKITVTKDGATLRAQATGQGAFALEPVSAGVFKFDQAGIKLVFDPAKPTFMLQQGGKEYPFTKE